MEKVVAPAARMMAWVRTWATPLPRTPRTARLAIRAATTAAASVPDVRDPLGVAALGLAPADADQVEALRTRLERTHHRGGDTQHVPRHELDDLVAELGATGARDDDIGLLLLAMPVAERHAGARLIGEATDAELG